VNTCPNPNQDKASKIAGANGPAPTELRPAPPAQTSAEARDRSWINQLVQGLRIEQFYGIVELKFEKGKIVRAIKHQNMLPPSRG